MKMKFPSCSFFNTFTRIMLMQIRQFWFPCRYNCNTFHYTLHFPYCHLNKLSILSRS
ncbi:hypothetical protein BMB171_C2262 [Bacillus thuringiensis BMB171]|nr:hypothetical protein BMB171_C2262 [Bacillus thuringiensis BMB171]